MYILKLLSILLVISGSILFGCGIGLYWNTNPVVSYASIFIMIGMIMLIASIGLLCIGEQYDVIDVIDVK